MRRLALVLVLLTSTAYAGPHEATFAHYFAVEPSKVHDVVGFELPPGTSYSHVLAGRYASGKATLGGVVLLRCKASACRGTTVSLSRATEVHVLGIVDLHGGPTALPSTRIWGRNAGYEKLGERRSRWPVLVVRTRDVVPDPGEPRREVDYRRMRLISLGPRAGATVFLDAMETSYPSGAGHARSYRLERAGSSKALDLVATERKRLPRDRRCKAPPPVEVRFTLEDHRYVQANLMPRVAGC